MSTESPPFLRENNKKEKNYQFHFEEVEQLRNPAKRILYAIRDNIERGSYQLIIGDDASGRVPALLFSRVIKNAYREKGYELPDVHFFAGSTHLSEEEKPEKIKKISDFLQHKKTHTQKFNEIKKALIVTDFIETGSSLDPLVSALEMEGIDFDVVSIAGELEERWGKNIIYGSETTPPIYGKDSISGVYKNNHDLFSKPAQHNLEGIMNKEDVNKNVADAREDVSFLASELEQWYNNTSKK